MGSAVTREQWLAVPAVGWPLSPFPEDPELPRAPLEFTPIWICPAVFLQGYVCKILSFSSGRVCWLGYRAESGMFAVRSSCSGCEDAWWYGLECAGAHKLKGSAWGGHGGVGQS